MNTANYCHRENKNLKDHCAYGQMKEVQQFLSTALITPIQKVIERTAAILNISPKSVKNVLNRAETEKKIETPGKHHRSDGPLKNIDSFTIHAIRIIMHSYFERNEPVTLDKILIDVKRELGFPYGRSTLWGLLKSKGFVFRKRGNRLHLLERADVRNKRYTFLREFGKAELEGKPFWFQDETWLNQNYTTGSAWYDTVVERNPETIRPGSELTAGYKDHTGKGQRLIISHIGSESGFLPGGLLLFRSKKTVDYHEEMNSEKFEGWFEKILQSLPEPSNIVIDNASYHSRLLNPPPNSNTTRPQMEAWLQANSALYDSNCPTKKELYTRYVLPIRDEEKYKEYAIDEMAKKYGHTVIRLPPYHCIFNPIELIWSSVKRRAGKRNSTGNLADVTQILEEELTKTTAEEWQGCINHSKGLIHEYMAREKIVLEKQVSPLVIEPDDDDGEEEIYVTPEYDDIMETENDFDVLGSNAERVISDYESEYLKSMMAGLKAKFVDLGKKYSWKKPA